MGYVRNFNNALVYTSAFSITALAPGVIGANLGPPRTVGARIAMDF
jgi:hypothetical protein